MMGDEEKMERMGDDERMKRMRGGEVRMRKERMRG